jgi:hypothetical protein
MEEEEGNGAATPPLEPRRHELLAAAVREGDTPAAAVSIHMNFEGSCENFLQPAPPPSDGGARSSAGCAAAASFNLLTPQSIMGLTFVGAAGAAAQSVVNTAAAGAARGGRNAELQWKDKHSDNAFRLDPGHCHHLSNPNVLIAYNKWATIQSTAKKAPYWAFYDELKAAVGKYPPVWRCVGCHPVAEAALDLYEQKKELKAMPKGLVRYG